MRPRSNVRESYPEIRPMLLQWAKRFSASEEGQGLLAEPIRCALSDLDVLGDGNLGRSLFRLMLSLAKRNQMSNQSRDDEPCDAHAPSGSGHQQRKCRPASCILTLIGRRGSTSLYDVSIGYAAQTIDICRSRNSTNRQGKRRNHDEPDPKRPRPHYSAFRSIDEPRHRPASRTSRR